MLKDQIIEKVAKDAKLTKKAAREAIDSALRAVQSSVNKGEKVVLSGFGTFVVRTRRARKEPNPKTGAPLPAMKTVGFIASKAWKKVVR